MATPLTARAPRRRRLRPHGPGGGRVTDAVTITSKEELERWLSDKPREWAVAIAARAALRVVPVLGTEGERRGRTDARVGVDLPVFRAVFLSSTMLGCKAKDRKALAIAAFAASRAALAAANVAASSNVAAASNVDAAAAAAGVAAFNSAAAADAVRSAANTAAYGAYVAYDDAYPGAADAADAAAAFAADAAVAEVWAALSRDARTLAAAASDAPVATLLRTPLWPGSDIPAWVQKGWALLRDAEALKAAGFDVWFDWYEGLLPLKGSTPTDHFGPDLTRRIALQPPEWWDRGAEAVNADIAAWLAERDAVRNLPPQQPADLQFRTAADWRIGVAPQDIRASDPAAAQAFLDELRERAADAARRLETARNAAPFLADEVARLCAFLPENAEDLNPYRLRNRLATIDAAVMTLQTAGPSRELADDPVIQVTALALVGRELGLCFPDLRTRERDEIARSIPVGQERPIVEALAETPAAAAAAPDMVDAQAVEGLEIITTMARESLDGPPDAQRERIVEQVVVDRNFKSEAAKLGWRLWDLLTGPTAGAGVRHALVFGYAALLTRLGSRELGAASVLSGHGQTDRALKLLEEQFRQHAKDLKDAPAPQPTTKKKPKD